MQKKNESHKSFLIINALTLVIALCFSLISSPIQAQQEELKQKVEALKTDHEENYELKFLNISSPNLGMIDDSFPAWKDRFMLQSREKRENNLGRKAYDKFYINIYAYETLKDRQYALKDWLEDFIEGESVRPGREMRTYQYATPTIILINDTEIIVLNYKCSSYTYENFKDWRERLLKYFGQDNTMVIEIECDGPLKWTKNAPDPRTRGLF